MVLLSGEVTKYGCHPEWSIEDAKPKDPFPFVQSSQNGFFDALRLLRMTCSLGGAGVGAVINRPFVIVRLCEVLDCTHRYCASSAEGVTFLSPNKKVTKEVGLGEALTVKPIGTSSVSLRIYPVFKPSSPKTLSRPPSLPG